MSAPLDYAPAATRFSRRRIALLALVCIIIALGVAWWRWGSVIRSRIRYLQLQRQCMNYTAPAGQVMFTTDDDERKQLIALGGEYHDDFVFAGGSYLAFGAAGFEPLQLKQLRSHYAMWGGSQDNVIFMHARRTW